jgi:hypothetical protein
MLELTTMLKFPNKLPAYKTVLIFDFANQLTLGNLLTGITSLTVTVASGVDPSPSSILNGAAALDSTNTMVLQPVAGGIPGVCYLFDVQVTTANVDIAPEAQGLLPVGY